LVSKTNLENGTWFLLILSMNPPIISPLGPTGPGNGFPMSSPMSKKIQKFLQSTRKRKSVVVITGQGYWRENRILGRKECQRGQRNGRFV
jgi:hypothetical protein